MHSLVGIDTCVFNKNLFFRFEIRLSEKVSFSKDLRNKVISQRSPTHFEIDVPGRRNSDFINICGKVGSDICSAIS